MTTFTGPVLQIDTYRQSGWIVDLLRPIDTTDDKIPPVNFGGQQITSDLHVEQGSWTTTALDDGRFREDFDVFASESLSGLIRNAYNVVAEYFETAKRLHSRSSADDAVILKYRAEGEQYFREAEIISGSITELDDLVVRRGMRQRGTSRITARFHISLVRYEWEITDKHVRYGGTWRDITASGDYRIIPSYVGDGNKPGRIETMQVFAIGGTIQKGWIGMKPATSGTLNGRFDPEIDVGNSLSTLGDSDTWRSVSTDFIDGDAAGIAFSRKVSYGDGYEDKSPWAMRCKFPMSLWNSTTGTESNLDYFLGDYYLVARYKTTDIGDAKIGIRAATGYDYQTNLNYLDRIYLDSTFNPDTFQETFSYVNLGRMSIGGTGWTKRAKKNMNLGSYSVYIEASLIDGSYKDDFLYLDNMYLVPAEHYINFDLSRPFDGTGRLEIFQDLDGAVSAFVTAKTDEDIDVDAPLNTRKILWGTTDITTDNFAWPNESGSAIVFVLDREDLKTKDLGNECMVATYIARRSTGYST